MHNSVERQRISAHFLHTIAESSPRISQCVAVWPEYTHCHTCNVEYLLPTRKLLYNELDDKFYQLLTVDDDMMTVGSVIVMTTQLQRSM